MTTENHADLEIMTDEELVLLASDNNQDAVLIIFARYKKWLKNWCRSYYLQGADDDDLMQEAFIGLYKAIRDYNLNEGYTFKQFAYLCVKRHVFTAVTAATRQKHRSLNNAIALQNLIADESEKTLQDTLSSDRNKFDPEQIVITKESINELMYTLTLNLTQFEYKVLLLKIDGFDHSSAALLMGCSYRGIINALCRIRKKARKLFPYEHEGRIVI